MHRHIVGDNWLGFNTAARDLQVIVDNNLHVSQ